MSNDSRQEPETNLANVERRPRTESSYATLLLNHLDTAVCCLNAEAQFLYANLAFCDLIGVSAQDLQSLAFYELELDSSLQLWQEQWQLLKYTRSLIKPTQYQIKPENCLPVVVSMTYVEHQGQEIVCASIRTAPQTKQNRLALADSLVLEQNKALSEFEAQFIAVICHQFRSLLNIISFSNSLLKRHLHDWTVTERKPYLEHIQTAVEQITQLLDKSMLFGKSVTGAIGFEPISLNVTRFCQDLIQQMQPMLKINQQEIVFESLGDCCIRADPNLLHIILFNLLSNASKYSPPNSMIRFTLGCAPQRVTLEIQDTGIGISETDQQRLFEPFYRGSNVGERPGTGLGLSIVKNIVESQGGQINLTSIVNVGTTVSLILPT